MAAETEDCLGRQFGECLHRLHQDLEMKIITNFTEDRRNILKNGQNMSLELGIDLQVQDHQRFHQLHLHQEDHEWIQEDREYLQNLPQDQNKGQEVGLRQGDGLHPHQRSHLNDKDLLWKENAEKRTKVEKP